MAAKNAKPTNSSDSENEWTFIDTYDGTIETRKNCVTYRKPTFAEAVRGVSDEELAEVESEPEFEVLASFQFRSKGESFGIGSSAPKNIRSPEEQRKADDVIDDQAEKCTEDDILFIPKRDEPVCSESDDDNVDEIKSNGTDDAIVVVDEGFSFDDTIDDDDDDMIDLGESKSANGDEAQRTSFINTSLNNICIYDDDDDDDDNDDDDEPDEVSALPMKPDCSSPVNKWLLCIDALESSKDLAWDNLTFNLMNTMPLMMASATAVDTALSTAYQNQDSDHSESSFEPISNSDSASSYDNLDDLSDDGDDIVNPPLIPRWFFNPHHKIFPKDNSSDGGSFEMVDAKFTIPDWLYNEKDESCKELTIKDTTEDLIIPKWFHEANHNTCKDWDDNCTPIIPAWFYNPDHTTYDKTIESIYSEDSDSDWEYTDDSDCDDEEDDDSTIAIPDWLFGERKNTKHHQDDDGLLFSQLFVDVPTFIILLFLTTALGFSIGHGLTVYFGAQSLNRNKLQAPTTQSNVFPNDLDHRMLTAEEIAKVDLMKLEDEIYRQKEGELLSSHLRYDLNNIHKNLKEKHTRLLRNYKSAEDRLHISKSMSWFWRLKYDQEKRRTENSSSVVYLQKQLERIGALYEKEKKVANKWRRYKNTHFPIKKINSSIERNSSKEKNYNAKASLASKYWVQAILSSQTIDWESFKKRWTEDVTKLNSESCSANASLSLKRKASRRNPFAVNKTKQFCKRGNDLDKPQNLTNKKSTDSMKTSKKGFKNTLHQRVFGPPVPSPVGPPMGPLKMKRRGLKFGPISIDKISRKGETARRRRNERLEKRKARTKALEIKLQVKELKNVIAELRRERRKAEREKFQLEASWRKLRTERENLKKEQVQKHKSDTKEIKKIKTKLKRATKKLKTWKNVATQFKKKSADLERDVQKLSRAKKTQKDIKNIKRDLKLEKRKLREQRQDLKTLKHKLRQEHRNYAREGWKLAQKQKKLEQIKASEETAKKTRKQPKKRATHKTKTPKGSQRKSHRPYESKKSNKSKKSRWKQKETFLKYWEKLEKTLKNFTRSLKNTVREKSGGKIQKVWNRLQEKFGNLINFNWGKSRNSKPPFNTKKKHKKKKTKTEASLIYEKVLAEQREFDRRKRKELDESRKQMKSRSPTLIPKKKKEKRKMDTEAVVKKRRKRQRRKYQRELERLQQWALQMNEKQLEHERMYKDKNKKRSDCTEARFKLKSKKKAVQETENGLNPARDNYEDSIDDTSNLTNTLMLVVQPEFIDHQYEMFTKFDAGTKDHSENTRSIIHDITMAQMNHDRVKQQNTELSIPFDDESAILPSTKPPPTQKRDFSKDEQISNKPTPPLLDPSMYNKLAMLGIIDSHKGGSIGLPIPPTVDPLKIKDSTTKQDSQTPKTWNRDKTTDSWIPPPEPVQSDGSIFQMFTTQPEKRKEGASLTKRKIDKQNPSESGYSKDKGNDNWMFLRASGRAHQRILYEPLNKQSAKDRYKRKSKKTYFHRNMKHKKKNKDGSWVFDRANDREEQRLNKDPWYMRRAEGREGDREQEKNAWFLERGFERELQRNEEGSHDYDDQYDNDYDDDDYYYDDDFGYDVDDDISAA